jgi:cytochrome c
MPTSYLSIFLGLALSGALPGTADAAGDALRGQMLYQSKCAACHSIDYNGVGPAHRGVFGHKAGSQADYVYSPAVQRSNVIWTESTLDKWLTNPEKFIPGQKMGFMVPSAKDRTDLIAYLKKEAAKK